MKPFVGPQGQRCAVSLTYDDGLPVHYQLVGPLLETHGLRGTFYVPGDSDVRHHPEAWRDLAARGHELGNHSLFHPCRQNPEDPFDWLPEHYNLASYTPKRWEQELDTANLILRLVDGKSHRSYGNTCCNTTIGEGNDEISMTPILQERFGAARGPHNNQIAQPGSDLDLYMIGHFSADFRTCDFLRSKVEDALASNGWVVWMNHGVGAETHGLHIQPEEHAAWIKWLGEHKETIWTAPLIEVADYTRNTYQKGN